MRAFTAAVAAALWLPVPSPGAPPSPVFTEADLLAGLGPEHPEIVILAEELARAQSAAVAARTLANPELGVAHEDPEGAVVQLDVIVSWTPPRPGHRRLAGAAADAEVLAAARRRDLDLLDLRLFLREIYARWSLAWERAGRLSTAVERLESLELRTRRRAEEGEASGLEARRIALSAASARAELARAQAELAVARGALRALRPDLPDGVRPELPPLPAVPELDGTSHPRIAALERELEAVRLSRRLAGRVLEMPEVVAGWQRQEDAGGSVEGPIVGLAWPLPVFDRNRAERMTAEARLETVAAELELARRRVAARRTGAVASYSRLREAAGEARASAAEGDIAVDSVTSAFRLGEADLTDLLETLRSARAVELSALDLHEAALAAHRELERISGRPQGGPAGPGPAHFANPEPNPIHQGDLP